MSTRYWRTKEGEEIAYNKLKNSHLLNILKWIQKRAANGVLIATGGGGGDPDDMWYDEEFISGKKVIDHYDYKGLLKEAKRRRLGVPK